MKSTGLLWTCALVLWFAYIASYPLLVRRGQNGFVFCFYGHPQEGLKIPIAASYRAGGRCAEVVYAPLLKVDRYLRPRYWSVTFHTNTLSAPAIAD